MTVDRVYDFSGTPFNPRTAPLNKSRRWVSWDRYHLVDVFSDIASEIHTLRQGAVILDMTPLSKYRVSGRDAVKFVDRLITRDANKIAVDQVVYTPWCNEKGLVVGDGLVFRLDETTFQTASDPMDKWYAHVKGTLRVSIKNVTDDIALLALQGPQSPQVLEKATSRDWSDLRFSRGRKATIGGIRVHVWRQGFTGEIGFEFWVPPRGAVRVWDALMKAGEPVGLVPAGMFAEDVARIEAGLLIVAADYYGAGPDRSAHPSVDVTSASEVSPFEIGVGEMVDFSKKHFIGKAALLSQRESGVAARRLAGLVLDWKDIDAVHRKVGVPPVILPRVQRDPAVSVFREDQRVGHATSLTWSPTVRQVIGFGHLSAEVATPGSKVWLDWKVGEEHGKVGATVVKLPFLDLKRAS